MLDLRTLLTPLPPARFLRQHWGRRSYVTHAAPARLPALFRAPALQSPAALLAGPAGAIHLLAEDRGGRVRQTEVGPAEALRRYRRDSSARLTIVVDQPRLPGLDGLLSRLAAQLGSPIQGEGSRATLLRAGRRTGLRFDHQEVFVVQITGRTRWRIAANRHLPSPTQPYLGGALAPELALCARGLPGRMPAPSRPLTLRPGSVLFLPRGTWQQTETLEDSILLGLTFPTLNWIDLLTRGLRARLVTRPPWRAIAAGLVAPGRARARADAQLLDLARAIGGELAAFESGDFALGRP